MIGGMNMGEFRKLVLRRPFKPVEIRIRAGDPLVVKHPEFVHTIGDDEEGRWISVHENNGPPIIFEVEEVVSIRQLSNGRSRKAER